MVEIRLTGQWGLSKPTRPGLVRPGPPRNRICYFYPTMLCSNKAFLNETYCFHGLYGADSALFWLGVEKICSQVSNCFLWIKWVILHDQLPHDGYSMRLIHWVIAFPPHAILSRMLYQCVWRACWFIPWQAALKYYYSYLSIPSEGWPGCHSESHDIFHKVCSGTSSNLSGPPKLVGSSHRHQPGRATLVLPSRLDRLDYSEPWMRDWYLRLLKPRISYPRGLARSLYWRSNKSILSLPR